MDIERFRARRAQVLDLMQRAGGGVAVLATAPEAHRNRDAMYPYRHDSHFYWLTGFTEPQAVVVLVAQAARRHCVLFCRDRHEEREIWEGWRHGPAGAGTAFGFDDAFPIDALDEQMPRLLADAPALFYPLACDAHLDHQVQHWLQAVRSQARTGVSAPAAAHDLHALLDELRLIKDDGEIATMRRAARIAAAGHVRAMQACRPGLREYHLEAELLHAFRSAGAQSPAYTSIVAAGRNACVLHYLPGDALLDDGALCLIDAGCELDSYASDVTRTFPVNGRYSGAQRAVYDIVLAAQDAALALTRPGTRFDAPHLAATRVLTQGMLDLGLLTGSLDGALESGAFRRFYMHRTGHWLGLDVHDVGDYREPGTRRTDASRDDRPWRALAPGMVVTVEPGLYIRAAQDVPPHLHDIGVRIEDDVLITAAGHEILSDAVPKRADDIEALMRR